MKPKIEIKSGDRYGRLTIIKEVEPKIQSNGIIKRKFACLCDCGNESVVRIDNLRNGNTKSCGCFQKNISSETAIRTHTTHGLHEHYLYKIWNAMKYRCLNPNCNIYKDYGGRGITICDRWINSFVNFLEDMGERPEGYSIDRIDVNGNYEPSNCRWATPLQQTHNRRTSKRKNNEITRVSEG